MGTFWRLFIMFSRKSEQLQALLIYTTEAGGNVVAGSESDIEKMGSLSLDPDEYLLTGKVEVLSVSKRRE